MLVIQVNVNKNDVQKFTQLMLNLQLYKDINIYKGLFTKRGFSEMMLAKT